VALLPQQRLRSNLLERPDDPAVCSKIDVDWDPVKTLNEKQEDNDISELDRRR
jgi:hypothetical protein